MQKMLIKINKEKMKELGISEYYIDLTLHDAFDEGHFFIEEHDDGSIMYTGNPEYPNYFGLFGAAVIILSDDEKFMSVCEKWIWYDDARTKDDSFDEEDILEQIKDGDDFDD